MHTPSRASLLSLLSLPLLAAAAPTPLEACPNPVVGSVPSPSSAPGYEARLIAKGFNRPRSIKFDRKGNLLVIEDGKGLTAVKFNDDGGTCLWEASRKTVIDDTSLNHGLELSPNGKTLYVSNADVAYAYPYNATAAEVTGPGRKVITGMYNSDHDSRTMMLSKKKPGMMVVNRGSSANIDGQATDVNTGHAQVKAFDLSALGAGESYDFTTQGILLGMGLRNNVGIAEDPAHGGVYTVENSADNVRRNGVDVHQNNPGERLNYLGTLVDNVSTNQGSNFGYPQCFAAWGLHELKPQGKPRAKNLKVGSLFAVDQTVSSVPKLNDTYCREQRTAPRLTFQAHMAPLDIEFTPDGSEMYVSFHGSWNRDVQVGRKVSKVMFANGDPVEPTNSKKSAIDIVRNGEITDKCYNCFRPVGLEWDSQGRLLFSSDATGEIYAIRQTN